MRGDIRNPTTRSRSASSCYKAWGAGYREVPLLFSCCRGILQAPEWSQSVRHRRETARPYAVVRRSLLVAEREATVFRLAALSRRSCLVALVPRHIRSRFAVRERFLATRNPVIFETLLAKCLARICRAAAQTVSRTRRSAVGYPVSVLQAAALQFETCLAGGTNRNAAGSPRALEPLAGWSTRSP